MIRVVWFNNPHEHHNDLLRLGLMRLHRQKRLRYEERKLCECVDFGFSKTVTNHLHRRTSVISVKAHSNHVRCIVDSEDSFFWMSSLIREADVYFCSGYNSAFFEQRIFEPPYPWLHRNEVVLYEKRARELIETYADFFDRVRRYVPIGPELSRPPSRGWWRQKLRNVIHKAQSHVGETVPWYFRHKDLEERYQGLLDLREAPLLYDVVLQDTLWGWPRHRLALHQRLKELSGRYAIHSQLHWKEPLAIDGSDKTPMEHSEFPVSTQPIVNYEHMLASSRLAVFATGFHWGWRSIMMLALLFGLPVHADRLILEPWFDMGRFAISWNDSFDWQDLETKLDAITLETWNNVKAHNQRIYDEVMAPDRVAEYFVSSALGLDALDPTQWPLGKRSTEKILGPYA